MDESQTSIYAFGEFRLDAAKRLLLKADDEIVPLMPKAFDTLLYLVRNSGKIIEKEELMREIWADSFVEENNLSQNISILRKTLGERRGEHRFIATVPGRGFKFVAEVREIQDSKFKIQDSDETPDETEIFEAEAEKPNSDFEKVQEGESETGSQTPAIKNQNRKWMVVLVVLGVFALGAAGFFLWRENQKAASEPIRSIAVLPFKPLVAENRDEALEMGMADTLIARLDNNREFTVRPLSSVRKFNDLEQDALQAGRQLGVESVLEGNIQRWGDKIRVNVRLLAVASGESLYSGTFDEKFTDIFVVQDAISEKVAEALKIHLGGNKRNGKEKRDTENIEAYRFYLQGRYHALKLTPPEIRKGIAFYQRAIDADPLYATAYAGMADAYRTLPITSDVAPDEAFPKAKAAAQKALEIDDQSAEAYIVLGWIESWYEWNWNESENYLKKALQIKPGSSEAHRAYAHLLSQIGRHDEAVEEIKKAREADPLSLIINALEGQFLFYAGREPEAIERLNKTLEIEPNFWVAHINLAKIYINQKRFDEAIKEARIADELSGGNSETLSLLGYAQAQSGQTGEARSTLEKLKSAATAQYSPDYNIALIHNGLGEREEALNSLEKAFQSRDVRLTLLKIDPKWNDLRGDPRFVELMRRMNFD